jgi:histidinol-phosphate/aromatic aminotransferase/cobyric acid decarboxylase-like protein
MKAFWSRIARELSPYVPGEQPRIANLVKLNTNESPFGPSPLALEAGNISSCPFCVIRRLPHVRLRWVEKRHSRFTRL